MNKNSKIYVAGHKGMVGSAIIRNLTNKGYTNIIIDKKFDLRNQENVNSFFEKYKPEYVFIAAAKVGGIHANNTYRADFIYDNLMIQSNIIHASYLNNVKKLLFLGSSCIFPKMSEQPIKEESLLTGLLESTNEPYAIAKIAGIKMCEAYRDQYGCNFISVMPTNLYGGPEDNYNLETSHVLPAILRKIYIAKCLENNDTQKIIENLKKQPFNNSELLKEDELVDFLGSYGIFKNSVILWGSGNVYREFLHVDDMSDACVYMMETYNEKQFINIGSGIDLTIKELSHIIKNVVDFKGDIIFDSSKPDGTPKKLLDVSRLNSLGWEYKINIRDGIKMVYDQTFKI